MHAQSELEKICGSGSIATVSGTVTAVAGVGGIEKIQAANGSGATSPVKGCGGVDWKLHELFFGCDATN